MDSSDWKVLASHSRDDGELLPKDAASKFPGVPIKGIVDARLIVSSVSGEPLITIRCDGTIGTNPGINPKDLMRLTQEAIQHHALAIAINQNELCASVVEECARIVEQFSDDECYVDLCRDLARRIRQLREGHTV